MRQTLIKVRQFLFILPLFAFTSFGFAQNKNVNSTSSMKAEKENCGCDYFPLCKYDVEKSFMGETWKGLLDDNGRVTYYYCKGGLLRAKLEVYDNFNGDFLGYETFTMLNTNLPEGATWKETVSINGAVHNYIHKILRKNIEININGNRYSNAIKVNKKLTGSSTTLGISASMELENSIVYFVKNIGVFKEDAVIELNPVGEAENKYLWQKAIPLFLWKGIGQYDKAAYAFLEDGTVRKFEAYRKDWNSNQLQYILSEFWSGKWRASEFEGKEIVEVSWEENYKGTGAMRNGKLRFVYYSNNNSDPLDDQMAMVLYDGYQEFEKEKITEDTKKLLQKK